MTERSDVGDADALGFMRLLALVTEANDDRATESLDSRQRHLIQLLGLTGPQPLAVLGQRLGGLSPSTMTGVADRMEKGGYVRRRPGSDRRVALLVLTAKGRRAFDFEVRFFRALIAQTIDELDDDSAASILHALRRFSEPE